MSNTSLVKTKNKKVLLDEVRLTLELGEHGVHFDAEALKRLRGQDVVEDPYRREKTSLDFVLPHGINTSVKYARWTPYSIVIDGGKPVLLHDEQPVGELAFEIPEKHPELEQVLGSGVKVRSLLSIDPHGQVNVGFSDECALKDNGEDCLFCSYNVRERDPSRPAIKSAVQNNPPMTLKEMKSRYLMFPIPATIGATVRMTGMKRANMMVFLPCSS